MASAGGIDPGCGCAAEAQLEGVAETGVAGVDGRRVQPQRPRHTVEEVAAFFAALPEADPRLLLLIELTAELRAGQAVRAKRSDLVLALVGGFGLGRFVVHGRGKKHGEVVDLHPELRTVVDEMPCSGYLSGAEAAYRRDEVEASTCSRLGA